MTKRKIITNSVKMNENLIKDYEINKFLSSSSRTVLIEKSPVLAILNSTTIAIVGLKEKTYTTEQPWCCMSYGRKLMVIPINKTDWENALENIWISGISFEEEEFPSKSDYVIVIDCDDRRSTMDERNHPFLPIGTWIHLKYLDFILDKNGDKIYNLIS